MNILAPIFMAFVAAGPIQSSIGRDCGYELHKQAIKNTEILIIKRENLVIPISEIPTKNGTKECVRLGFSISNRGVAQNIVVLEDSRSFDMNVSAVNALKKYKFHYSKGFENSKFTLVFRGVVGKAPPYPSQATTTGH